MTAFPPPKLGRGAVQGLSVLLLTLTASAPARSEPLPLPLVEQGRVKQAIGQGVYYLKKTQGPLGTWASETGQHKVGYAALPALTLLECGVPVEDLIVQK